VTPSNLWKSFTVPETRVFHAADGEDPSLHRFWLVHPCDGRTDGQTDRQLRWPRRTESSSCFRA